MAKKRFSSKWILGLSALFIYSCNVFNPSGDGDLPESAEGRVSVGQSHLQNQKWDEAIEAFSKAIEKDSTNSFAYYGYSKAVRFKYDLNGLSLSEELTGATEGGTTGQVPFVSASNEELNVYLAATSRLKPVLSKLVKRDSLTRLWRRSNENPINYDKITDAQVSWINNYLEQAKTDPTKYKVAEFPLMDGVINYEKITPDLTLILLVHTFVGLKDLNNDGIINEDDNLDLVENVLSILDSGLSAENLQENVGKLVNDPETAEDVNNLIDKISSGTEDISTMLSLAGDLGADVGGGTDTTGGAGEELTGEVQETIASLGNTIVFYKFNDLIDNDGDGCVDEEAFDQVDNDGDGLIDEDATTFKNYIAVPGVKDTVSVITDNLLKDPSQSGGNILAISEPDIFANYKGGEIDFGDANFWVSDTIANEIRFKVVNEITKGLTPPYNNLSDDDYNYLKTNIGGCWKYY